MKRVLVEPHRYFDSVFLMRISVELEKLEGVSKATVAMGTPANLENLSRIGFAVESRNPVRPTDLIIAVEAESEAVFDAATDRLQELLAGTSDRGETAEASLPASLGEALELDPHLNLALISVPGAYAAREARQALRLGLHVMLFSDNVSVDDEVALKDEALRRGLLMMGPDCGTAILNGRPLGFANAVRRGRIGIVGASGTGIQEISSLIDRFGGGISQAIGTGGRDLSEAVAARSTLAGIDDLAADLETDVLVVVSKAPASSVAEAVIARLEAAGKPAVVHFVSATARQGTGRVIFADTLDAAARAACHLSGLEQAAEPVAPLPPRPGFGASQSLVRGLFCGGTLCQEAWGLLHKAGLEVRSNVATVSELKVHPEEMVNGHVLWDLGDDAFTVGRPHPMIEPELRDALVAEAGNDPTVAVILVDCVLGYGAHEDPAGSLATAVQRAAAAARRAGRTPPVTIASITGTASDPQGYDDQRHKLEQAGALVADSNALAAQAAAALLRSIEGGSP